MERLRSRNKRRSLASSQHPMKNFHRRVKSYTEAYPNRGITDKNFIETMKNYNKEVREANKKLSELQRERMRSARTANTKHRAEVVNIQEQLLKEQDIEKANMKLLATKPYFNDLKALKEDFMPALNPEKYKVNLPNRPRPPRDRKISIKEARTPNIRLSCMANTLSTHHKRFSLPFGQMQKSNYTLNVPGEGMRLTERLKISDIHRGSSVSQSSSRLLIKEPRSSRVNYQQLKVKNSPLVREVETKRNLKTLQKVLVRQSMLTSTKMEDTDDRFL